MAGRDGTGPGEAGPRYRAVDPKELLPCPFCGSADVQSSCVTDSWFLIRCRSCGIEMENHDSTSAVVKLWNARPAAGGGDALIPLSGPRNASSDKFTSESPFQAHKSEGSSSLSSADLPIGPASGYDTAYEWCRRQYEATGGATPDLRRAYALYQAAIGEASPGGDAADLAREVAELRKALAPFAALIEPKRMAAYTGQPAPVGTNQGLPFDRSSDDALVNVYVRVGDIRAAALSPRPSGADPGRGTGDASKGEAR